jgi:hypothetical protein
MSCHGLFYMGHKEFGNLLSRDYTFAINKSMCVIEILTQVYQKRFKRMFVAACL